MAEPIPTTNTYTTHTSLETISLKIKKLQSDLSSAATGQCWGPGKQKVLDCKHDVDVLALMVKELEVDGIARKKSLDMLVEASIDRLFDNCVRKVQAQVDGNMRGLIGDTLLCYPGIIKAAIKKAFDKEVDVLLDFEVKFMRYFKEAILMRSRTLWPRDTNPTF